MATKILLAFIGLGLWANAVTQWVRPAHAADRSEFYLSNISRDAASLGVIAADTARISGLLDALISGGSVCRNRKICD
jgi:hypothetical protein